jgi:hypothetical protein
MIEAATMDIGGLAASLGTLLGISTENAGWLLGGLLSAVLIVVGLILASKLESSSPLPLFFLLALGITLATLFGWFPLFVIFFAFVFALIPVIGLMASKGSAA